jgi:hypothetical protein
MPRATTLAAAYFWLQAAAVAAWWALLAVVPASRAPFLIRGAPAVALGAFAPADLVLVSLGSALVGWRRGRGWAGPLAWLVTGGMAYAALYTATTAVLGAADRIGAALMAPGAVASLAAAFALTDSTRVAPPAAAVPPRPPA